MKKLILIDGNNLMYRAYFATAYSGNLMKTSTGLYTNAIYGFVNMIEKIISDDFSHILVAFDAGKTTFRHQDYKEYKDGRKPTPSEFKVQIPIIKEYLDVRGIKRLEIDNFEADDIIGTAKTMYETEFDQIDIYSNDKDLLQLISDNTTMKSSKKGLVDAENYTPEYLKEKMGITPELITDLKGLMGDASDNLKGIPGVGEKTAIKLLNKYGNLEAIIDASDTITGKLGERIREHYEEAILCKKIATIFKEVDLGFGLKEMQYDDNNDDQLIDFYKRLEFHSLIKKRMKKDIEPKFSVNTDFTIMQSEVEINRILIDETSLHLETFGDNYHKTKPLGFALSNSLGNFFIPYDLIHTSISLQLFLSDESNNKSVFDLKKVKVVLRWDNYDIKGVTFDLLLAAYTLNPSLTKEDYKIIASAFDYDLVDYEETIYGKGVKKAIPEMETYAFHAVKKAIGIQSLKDKIITDLKDKDQYHLFHDIELPLASTLALMEFQGITVDLNMLDQLRVDFQERIDKIEEEIFSLAGEKFNVASPKQLGVILFEKLELPNKKKTKTGYSTNADVLNKLRDKHPIVEKVLEFRMLSKLVSTYVDGLKNAVFDDGKVHTIFKQATTQTGRLSSIEPNLQNIPIRTEEGRNIRKVFVPKEEYYLLAADYSQVELRVLAHMGKVTGLIEAFNNNEDIHSKTAREIFGVNDVTALMRRQAKAVNFGIVYGMSTWGLSEDIGISIKEADQFIKAYYHTFPEIKTFMASVVNNAINDGYVETILHRRRYIDNIQSANYQQREFAKRMAMNAPIQGSAADIIKIAMIRVQKEMETRKLKSKLVIQIHDELVFEVHKNEIEIMTELVKKTMENCVTLDVPLIVESSYGRNLYETK